MYISIYIREEEERESCIWAPIELARRGSKSYLEFLQQITSEPSRARFSTTLSDMRFDIFIRIREEEEKDSYENTSRP